MAFFLGETNVVDIHFLRERHSFSLSEVPGVAFLFLLPPTEDVAACVFGTGLARLLDRKRSRVRRAFNLAQFSLAAVVALLIFHAMASPMRAHPDRANGWPHSSQRESPVPSRHPGRDRDLAVRWRPAIAPVAPDAQLQRDGRDAEVEASPPSL